MELVGKYYKLPVQDSSQMFSKLRQTVIQSARAAIMETRLVEYLESFNILLFHIQVDNTDSVNRRSSLSGVRRARAVPGQC